MKNLPLSERPRERLVERGAEALSTSELIAAILGSGTKGKSVLSMSQELLSHFGSLRQLMQASIQDLCKVKGLGMTRAIQLKAALSLAGRISREQTPEKFRISKPEDAYRYVKDFLIHEKKEIFGILLQDVRGHVLKWELISIGTLTQTLVHPREIFHAAIRHLAASIILIHNHPSGDPSPSPQDYTLTQHLITAGRSLGIPIYDHLIIASQGFVSLKELGVNFFI